MPSAITRPAPITVIRSASWSASSRYCVVSSTVVPGRHHVADHLPHLVAAARVQAGGRLVEEEQAAAGSPGRPRCRDGGASRPSTSTTLRSAASASPNAAEQLVGARAGRRPCDRSCRRPNITRFSRPNSTSSRAEAWPTRPIEARTCAGERRTSWPATSGLALLAAGEGRERVDGGALARAVGPEQGVHGAGRDLEVEAVQGERVAVPLAQPAGDERGRRGGRGHAAPNVVRRTGIATAEDSIYSVRRTKKLG